MLKTTFLKKKTFKNYERFLNVIFDVSVNKLFNIKKIIIIIKYNFNKDSQVLITYT